MVVLCTARKAETKAREEEHKQQDRQQVQQDCHTLSVQNAEMQRQQLAQEPTLEHLASLSELSVLPAVSSSVASGVEVPVLHALTQGVSRVCSSHIALEPWCTPNHVIAVFCKLSHRLSGGVHLRPHN